MGKGWTKGDVSQHRVDDARNGGCSRKDGRVGEGEARIDRPTIDKKKKTKKRTGKTKKTHISIVSNSSRFLCLLKNAAARFFTRRASRLLSPVTSGGTKSFVLTRSPDRAFFVLLPQPCAGPTDGRFAGTTTLPAEGVALDDDDAAEKVCWAPTCRGSDCGSVWGDDAGVDAGLLPWMGDAARLPGTKSKTWCVGRHCSASGDRRPLRTLRVSGSVPGMTEGGEAEKGSANGS